MTEDDEIEATTYLRCNPQPGSLGHAIKTVLARIVELKDKFREALHKWGNEMQVKIGELEDKRNLTKSVETLRFAECLGLLDGIYQLLQKGEVNSDQRTAVICDIEPVLADNIELLKEWSNLAKQRSYVHVRKRK